MSASAEPLPDWEEALSAAAVHAEYQLSRSALTDLRGRFETVLQQLEDVAGWRTARVRKPVLILGSLDGIETGVRQLIRDRPLETTTLEHRGGPLTIPTKAEILRIKAVLILRRNATRDYLDFAALAHRLGEEATGRALLPFDEFYPQESGESALQQLQAQLATPLPYDLDRTELSEYRHLAPRWHDWGAVKAACARIAEATFEYVCEHARTGED